MAIDYQGLFFELAGLVDPSLSLPSGIERDTAALAALMVDLRVKAGTDNSLRADKAVLKLAAVSEDASREQRMRDAGISEDDILAQKRGQ